MFKFICGVVLGFLVATVGVGGVVKIAENAFSHAQAAATNPENTSALDSYVKDAKSAANKAVNQ